MAKYYDWKAADEMARLAHAASVAKSREAKQKREKQPLQESRSGKNPLRDAIGKQAGVGPNMAKNVFFVAKNKPELLDDVLA